MKHLKILFGSALLIIITACSTSGNDSAQSSDPDAVLKQAFDEQEMVIINEVISYYDNFVLSKTDQNKSIKDAYQEFLTVNGPLAEIKGDLSIFCLSNKERAAFLETLDKNVLLSLLHINDTVYWYSFERELIETEYQPYYVLDVVNHKYSPFLKVLSARNDFYSSYSEEFEICGCIAPSTYGDIFHAFDNEHLEYMKYSETFDFSRKEDRLAFIIPFLTTNENLYRKGMISTIRRY